MANQAQRIRAHQRARQFDCARDLRAYLQHLDARFTRHHQDRIAAAVASGSTDLIEALGTRMSEWRSACSVVLRACEPGATSAGWADLAHGLRVAFVRCAQTRAHR